MQANSIKRNLTRFPWSDCRFLSTRRIFPIQWIEAAHPRPQIKQNLIHPLRISDPHSWPYQKYKGSREPNLISLQEHIL